MNDPTTSALLLSLLLMGLAGSLHCVAMCGPILLGVQRALQARGEARARLDPLLYHGGRLWTYALLGFFTGSLGQAALGWQKPLTLLAAFAVIAGGALAWQRSARGLAALGTPIRCIAEAERTWLGSLLHQGPLARLLLGVLLGFLPCGLVYAALLVAFACGSPLLSALGMLAFGIGTLPALTAVLLGGRWAAGFLGPAGPRLSAALWILCGLLMLGRVLLDPTPVHVH